MRLRRVIDAGLAHAEISNDRRCAKVNSEDLKRAPAARVINVQLEALGNHVNGASDEEMEVFRKSDTAAGVEAHGQRRRASTGRGLCKLPNVELCEMVADLAVSRFIPVGKLRVAKPAFCLARHGLHAQRQLPFGEPKKAQKVDRGKGVVPCACLHRAVFVEGECTTQAWYAQCGQEVGHWLPFTRGAHLKDSFPCRAHRACE